MVRLARWMGASEYEPLDSEPSADPARNDLDVELWKILRGLVLFNVVCVTVALVLPAIFNHVESAVEAPDIALLPAPGRLDASHGSGVRFKLSDRHSARHAFIGNLDGAAGRLAAMFGHDRTLSVQDVLRHGG